MGILENIMKRVLLHKENSPISASYIACGNYKINVVHQAMEILHIYGFGNIDTVVSNNHRNTLVFTKISKERYLI